ncbi:MAG TPA: CPBP family intramembrane metalloprotease [Firmicutes bacterium]|nr:CPBP family intramembrane metalloprotease [Candidatus Fermentithermobacillaceae bacterium]
MTEWSRVSLRFLESNVVEELLFRATLIPFFEITGKWLFDMVSTQRAIVATSIAFSLFHFGAVLNAPNALAEEAAIINLFSSFAIGLFLGVVYSRSRNLLSVTALHWWLNLQNELMQYMAFRILWQ